MHPELHDIDTQLQSERWIVTARWYYTFLAFFLGMIAKQEGGFGLMSITLLSALAISLIANTIFHLYLRHASIESHTSPARNVLNVCQIGLDLIYFFVIILVTGGGIQSIGLSFFFIPIIISMVILGFRGAMVVATISGVFVFISVLAREGVLLPFLLNGTLPSARVHLSHCREILKQKIHQ